MDFIRPLGNTGILVSAIGLGTVKFGRNTAVKYPTPFDLPSDEHIDTLLRTSADLGVNLIDTAPAYGSSEQRLGNALARHRFFGSRDRWIIATKVGEEFDTAPDGTGVSRYDFSPVAVEASVTRSLARLRTDYLDIVLIHSDGNDEAIIADRGAIHALQSLKARGLIRAIGISIKSPAGGYAALGITHEHPLIPTDRANDRVASQDQRGPSIRREPDLASDRFPATASSDRALPEDRRGPSGHPTRSNAWCDVLMCTLNQSYTAELPLIHAAHQLGVGVLIKKAFQSGHAATTLTSPDAMPAAKSLDLAATALSYIFTRVPHAVSSVVVGTLNTAHLARNTDAAR